MKSALFAGALLTLIGCGQHSSEGRAPNDMDDHGLVFPVAGGDSIQNATFALEMFRRILLKGDSSREGAEGMLKRLRDEAARDTSLPSVLRDRWQTPVRIIMDLQTVTVVSAGPDRSFGTGDDLEKGFSRPEEAEVRD